MFKLFFTDDILEKIYLYSNNSIEPALEQFSTLLAESNKCPDFWKVDEVDISFGLLYLWAAFRVNLWETWETEANKSSNNIFSATMSFNRFQFIHKFITFDDKSTHKLIIHLAYSIFEQHFVSICERPERLRPTKVQITFLVQQCRSRDFSSSTNLLRLMINLLITIVGRVTSMPICVNCLKLWINKIKNVNFHHLCLLLMKLSTYAEKLLDSNNIIPKKTVKYGLLYRSICDSSISYNYFMLLYIRKPQVTTGDTAKYYVMDSDEYTKYLGTKISKFNSVQGCNIAKD